MHRHSSGGLQRHGGVLVDDAAGEDGGHGKNGSGGFHGSGLCGNNIVGGFYGIVDNTNEPALIGEGQRGK